MDCIVRPPSHRHSSRFLSMKRDYQWCPSRFWLWSWEELLYLLLNKLGFVTVRLFEEGTLRTYQRMKVPARYWKPISGFAFWKVGLWLDQEIAEKYTLKLGIWLGDTEWEKKLYSIMKKVIKVVKQTWVYSIPSRRKEGIMMKKIVENLKVWLTIIIWLELCRDSKQCPSYL